MGATGAVVTSTTSRWLRLVLVSSALVATPVLLAPAAARAQDCGFSFDSWTFSATVNSDASMDVTEVITYDFDGRCRFGIRSFEREVDKVDGFAAADPGGPLVVIRPEVSVSGDWEWELRQPTSNETIPFTLTYRVSDAVEVGSDVADLNWMFLGTDHSGVGQVAIDVRFPPGIPPANASVADDDTSVLRGFAHGPTNGVVRVFESRIEATVSGVGGGRFVEIRGIAPAEAFDVRGERTLLAGILAEERRIADNVQDEEDKRRLALVLTPVLSLIAAFGAGVLWFVGGRERKPTEVLGEYWREPLTERPAVALANLKRGTIDPGPTIAGTIVDMAQRGYVRIIGETDEGWLRDKTIHRYQWLGKDYGPDVAQYERDVLEMIFRGQPETTSEDVNDWAKKNQSSAQSRLKRIKGGVTREYKQLGYEAKMNGLHMGLLTAICAVVGIGSWILKSATDNGIAWVGVGVAVASFMAGSYLLRNRTQAGAEAAAKADGLKNYLKDFSRLDEAPIGHLILWERYLVFAVAFGVAADLVRGMEARVPQVANDPAFGVWYVGTSGHRFDSFDRISVNTASFVSAATPNRSGGGGGFSGGGSSGGGGGGGAGAR